MTSPLRVCHVLEAAVGGARRHVLDLVEGLDRGGCLPSLIVSAERDPAFRADLACLRASGVTVHEVPMTRSVRPWRDLPALLAIRRILARERPDIVHTHCSKAGFLGRLARRLAGGGPVVHTPHVFPFEMAVSPPLPSWYRFLEWSMVPSTDRFVLLHPGQALLARERLRAPEGRLAVIPNGVDHAAIRRATGAGPDPARLRAELGLPAGRPLIGLVGRLCPQKGQDLLLLAAPAILAARPDCRFVLVGGGSWPAMQRLAGAPGLAGRVFVLPQQASALPFYRLFDVLAMPSRWEGMPYAALEAMALAVPVVASAVGALPWMIADGASGRLVPPGDVPALVAGVLSLSAADVRHRMGVEARRTVQERFGLAAQLTAQQDLYRALAPDMETPGGGGPPGVADRRAGAR